MGNIPFLAPLGSTTCKRITKLMFEIFFVVVSMLAITSSVGTETPELNLFPTKIATVALREEARKNPSIASKVSGMR